MRDHAGSCGLERFGSDRTGILRGGPPRGSSLGGVFWAVGPDHAGGARQGDGWRTRGGRHEDERRMAGERLEDSRRMAGGRQENGRRAVGGRQEDERRTRGGRLSSQRDRPGKGGEANKKAAPYPRALCAALDVIRIRKSRGHVFKKRNKEFRGVFLK